MLTIDPPWPYAARATDTTHRARNPYSTMAMDQIKALPIAQMADPDGCVLWLWTTCAFIGEAYECLDAWGFDYVTTLTWVKDRMGLGDWLRGITEHCLIATKGGPARTLAERQRDADEGSILLSAPMRRHSRKPIEFYPMVERLCAKKTWEVDMHSEKPEEAYEIIESCSPGRGVTIEVAGGEIIAPDRLEIFARIFDGKIRPGWAVIGNEFIFSDEMPWEKRWRGLKGNAKQKLAAFDADLAAKLTRGEITLHAAKNALLHRDCDAFVNYEVARLEKATAPHMTLLPRFPGSRNASWFLVLKCPCGAVWERLTYFACGSWYWVQCPTCGQQHGFRMLTEGKWFESRPTPVNEHASLAGGMNNCIPIRELEAA
ncbi:MAG: MT-A70 family methyltransferase [Candidatus Sulfotelmatobacter sp.]